jgi:YHS domain-containing protein
MASMGREHDCCGHDAPDKLAGGVIDPVCGMTVDPKTAKWQFDHAGKTYYFCAARCRERFASDPEKYLSPKPAVAEAVPDGADYICPMHPEIRQKGPGSCPICGMALEPDVVTGDMGPNPELVDFTRRFWIGLALALPVLLLEMGAHVSDLIASFDRQTSHWIQMIFATPVVLWVGWPFFERAWASITSRHFNMFTLIALGTGVALLYSIVATLNPAAFPREMRGADGSADVYFESAAVIILLVLAGQLLELKAREKTSGAIRAASAAMEPMRMCPSNTCRWARASACAPASVCRWTARSPKAAAPSTSPW